MAGDARRGAGGPDTASPMVHCLSYRGEMDTTWLAPPRHQPGSGVTPKER